MAWRLRSETTEWDYDPDAYQPPPDITVADDTAVTYQRDPDPFTHQVGGSHYTDMAIQPIQYILANGIPYIESTVIKYVSRWRPKGGVEDLRKARHFLDMLINHESGKDTP